MIGIRSTLIAAAIALLLALLLLGQCQRTRTAGAEASLNAKVGQAAAESGADAVGAVGAVSARVSVSDQTGRQNDEAIRSAAGADQLVPDAVDGAGRSGLCRRAAYRADPHCVQFTPAK